MISHALPPCVSSIHFTLYGAAGDKIRQREHWQKDCKVDNSLLLFLLKRVNNLPGFFLLRRRLGQHWPHKLSAGQTGWPAGYRRLRVIVGCGGSTTIVVAIMVVVVVLIICEDEKIHQIANRRAVLRPVRVVVVGNRVGKVVAAA